MVILTLGDFLHKKLHQSEEVLWLKKQFEYACRVSF